MKVLLTSLAIGLTLLAGAQTTVTFENFGLPTDSFLNNAGPTGGFESGPLFLPNDYNPEFDAWSGWAISTDTDTLTPGFMNQYSAITGNGVEDSETYAVSFVSGGSTIEFRNDAAGSTVEGMYVTNSTYAYLSMLDGDNFAKKFGGETGDDPDFFLLTIKKYFNGELSTDSIDFYLADYGFEDNSRDYIVDEWTFVDLSALGPVDSLLFTLSSSDVGQFGMNTPAYFCIDNVSLAGPTGNRVVLIEETPFELFPNPAVDRLVIDWPKSAAAQVRVLDAKGRVVRNRSLQNGRNTVDVQPLPPGMYWLQAYNERQLWRAQPFVKR